MVGWSLLRRAWRPYGDEPRLDPRLHDRLNLRAGEEVNDVVFQHPVVYVRFCGAIVVFLLIYVLATVAGWPAFLVVLAALWLGYETVRAYAHRRDIFVVTTWRVVRLSGVLSIKVATMPIVRILDMTMIRPPLGRILGYGHFVFESAAQEQGLREIRFVPGIRQIDMRINDAVRREIGFRSGDALTIGASADQTENTEPIEGL